MIDYIALGINALVMLIAVYKPSVFGEYWSKIVFTANFIAFLVVWTAIIKGVTS